MEWEEIVKQISICVYVCVWKKRQKQSREARARKRNQKREDKMKICASRKGGEKHNDDSRDALCRRKIQQFECFHKFAEIRALNFILFCPFAIEFIMIGMKTAELCLARTRFSHNSFRNLEMTAEKRKVTGKD